MAACTGAASAVEAVSLSVDGRSDSPLDLDSLNDTLTWQMVQTQPCETTVCPGVLQTAYEIETAATIEDLEAGGLI